MVLDLSDISKGSIKCIHFTVLKLQVFLLIFMMIIMFLVIIWHIIPYILLYLDAWSSFYGVGAVLELFYI